ncbi:MAG TPA: CDF family Co(II)/Ni(II) efflux transporter DmeF [Methylomirabilota bacterium]|nr:CDF family Co(II)/Ni(II) efflux transporter DmeF [Methylomirabilota bacterium]
MIHEHHFGQGEPRAGEARTRIVVILTAVTMVVEIAAGIVYGSMALLADGLHMASHASALGLALAAYVYARRHAHDRRFSFGTGKVNALAGFASAVVLALFALMMAGESVRRFVEPVPIAFNEAIVVAVLGLVVNGLSVVILKERHEHGHHHGHEHHDHHGEHHHHDHNLRAAHLHVLADALTSLLAIVALLAAKHFGAVWMDPAMGVVGGALVAVWSWGLLRQTGAVLLDRQAPDAVLEEITRAVEADGRFRVADLHAWSIGPGYRAVILSVEASGPCRPSDVAALIPDDLGIAHLTVELRPAGDGSSTAEPA